MLSQNNLRHLNQQFKGIPPEEIISWAALRSKRPVITSNFKPYSASLLHAVTEILPDIPVIWCDTGYNTPQTYRFADNLISQLGLNIKIYTPLQTTAYRDAIMGMPNIDDPRHREFTDQVKLEPFRRAMFDFNPDVWFTNLRKGQTAFRDTLDILSIDRQGRLKVSPFYHWTDTQLECYLQENELSNEFKYFDPTKVLENRECGLHL
jgi:phosphoadenosine phosphosulfate reductase